MIESLIVFNGVTLNDRSVADANLSQSPYYWFDVRSVDGLFDSDISDEEHDIPGSIGVRSGDTFRRAKTLTFNGYVEALNLGYLRTGERVLHEMLADKAFHPLTFTLFGEEQVKITCRVKQDLKIVMTKDFTNMTFREQFLFALHADDPRTYKVSDGTLYPAWQA